MAERRMFAKTIVDSDAFLDMPLSAQALYFHLSMRADDDGFVNNPKKIQRMIWASDDDYKLLIAKSFVLLFESGVIVIKHWRINNYIRGDRYKETVYTEEKDLLSVKDNGSYTFGIPSDNHLVYQMDTQYRLGKDRLGKDNKKKTTFEKPTIDDVKNYCLERKNGVDPETFIDFYESKGWMIGKTHMKDWKAAVRTWEKRNKGENNGNVGQISDDDEEQRLRELDEHIRRVEAGEYDAEDEELRRMWD